MRYLLSISFLLFIQSCSSPYRHLQRVISPQDCVERFRPQFTRALYNTQVSVIGKHLSGILLIKKMPDSSLRMVFSTQTGFKYFDFGFSQDTGFTVYYIIDQMNKKPLIKTLKNDFNLILMRNEDSTTSYVLKGQDMLFHAFPQEKGVNYYVTDSSCTTLLRMEKSSRSKVVVEAIMQGFSGGIPDSIGITHKNFNFTIGLKRLDEDAAK